jgi:hypothetical protein
VIDGFNRRRLDAFFGGDDEDHDVRHQRPIAKN